MPNPYSDIVEDQIRERDAIDQGQQVKPANPYADAVKDVVDQKKSEREVLLKSAAKVGVETPPDRTATALAYSAKLQMPVDIVERNLDQITKDVRINEMDQARILRFHPELATWLSDPHNASLGQDDMPALRDLDEAIRALNGEDPRGILPKGYRYEIGKIVQPLPGGLANTYDTLQDLSEHLERNGEIEAAREIERDQAAQDYQERFGAFGNIVAGAAQSIQSTQRALGTRTEYDHAGDAQIQASLDLSPGVWGDIQRGIGGLIADVPLMLTGGAAVEGVVALSRLGKARNMVESLAQAKPLRGSGAQGAARLAGERAAAGKELASATRAAPLTGYAADAAKAAAASQPLAIREGINEGQDHGAVDGALAWLVETAVPGAFGRTGVERSLLPGATDAVADGWRGALGRMFKDAGLEATEESLTELAHAIREKATGADPTALSPDKLWRRLFTAGAVGGIAGSSFSLPAGIAEKYARDHEEGRRALVDAERINQAIAILAESKTNERSPERVNDLMDKTLGQGSRSRFIEADDFRATFADPAAAAAQLGLGVEYARALATGGQLQIPTTLLLQTAAKDPEFAKLVEVTKRAPDAKTANEAREFTARAPEALKRLQSEAAAATGDATQQTTEHDKQVADIEADINRRLDIVSPETVDRGAIKRQAKVVASALGSLAKRTGKSVKDLYTLKIRGDTNRVMRGEKFDLFDAMIERLRTGDAPSDRDAHGKSLVDFLREKGLADKALAGELTSLAESDRTRKPGERSLIREDGIDLDTAAMYAAEAGYLEEATPNALLKALDDEVRGGKPTFSTKGGNPQAQATLEALDQLRDAMREAGVDITASNQQIRTALADLEERQGSQQYGQPANTVAPKGKSLDVDALLRQWRKATGDRTPVGGLEAWEQLVDESAQVDAAQGKEYGQPAYHGTGNSVPYDSLRYDKVNASGGEGTQNEGWGVYVTKEKRAAQFYREQNRGLLGGGPSWQDVLRVYFKPGRIIPGYAGRQRVISFNPGENGQWSVTVVPEEHWAEYDRRNSNADRRIVRTHSTPPSQKELDKILAEEAPKMVADIKANEGRLYVVDIPDNTGDNYLDWDKPLREQSEGLRRRLEEAGAGGIDEGATGAYVYGVLSRRLGSPKAASDALRKAGVVGNKYKGDEDSGHNNYVIFQDVPVVEYNQPGNKKEIHRGSIKFDPTKGLGRTYTVNLFRAADVSTFLHESGHLFLELMGDLAKLPTAEQSLKDDAQRVLDWLGAKDFASITEDQHEQFARGFEAYLFEGKAPTSGLRSAFATIKAWMGAIYKSVRNLNVELTDDIRGVMDRLVAAEDSIDHAEAANGMDALLPREAFPTLEEWQKYSDAAQASRQASRDRLEGELLEQYQERKRAELAAQRAEIEAQVTAEVDAMPVYQALSVLQHGRLPDGTSSDEMAGAKLDREDLTNTWGEAVLKKLPGPKNISENDANRGPVVYANENGLAVEQFARSWGFPSGDAMVEALIQADDRDTLIQAQTAKRMREANPDPMRDGSLTDRANAALATDKRAELFRRELAALGKRTGQTPAPIEVLRQVARDQIAKTRVYDLAPDKFRIAAAKAARRVVDAASRQAWDEAYRAKTQEALNLELYRAARDAKEAGDQGRAYLRTFDTLAKRERIGKAAGGYWTTFDKDGVEVDVHASQDEARDAWKDMPPGSTYRQTNGYMERIDDVLDGFDLRRASNYSLRRSESFRKWIAAQQADGEQVDIDPKVIEDLGHRNWNDLTVEEQASVIDAVRNIERQAQLKNRLLKASRERELNKAREEIVGTIIKHQPNVRPDGQFDDIISKATGKVVGYFESHRKDSFLARRMDGDQDGGAVSDYLIRSRNEAAGEQEQRSYEESAKLSALFKEWGKSGGAFLSDIPGTKMRMTTEQRIALALNWGSKEGRQRVMAWLKRGNWHGGDAQAVLDSLDAADWKLVNGIVAQINAHWSDIAALEQRTKGIAPEKVDAVPFVTKLGVQPGGYFPIKYDPAKSTKAGNLQAQIDAKDMIRGAFAQTKRGHAKLRAMEVDDLALRFDFGVIGEHLSEVIHDLTHRELTLDQNRLLRDPEISKAIMSRYGRGALDQFVKTATDIAVGDAPARTDAERIMKALRVNNSAATFGYNLTSALMNLTGFLQSMTRVDPRYMAQAVARLFQSQGNLNNGFAFAVAKSDLIRNRSNTLLREVADATRAVQPGNKLATARAVGYYPMMQVQRVVDTITWLGAYEQALAKGEKEGKTGPQADADAVAIANQTVIDTQGSGRIGDLSAFQRGGELSKLITAFYSYFNVAANLQGSAIRRVAQNPANAGNWGRLVWDTLMVWTLPAILGNLIRSALAGDDRKDEERWSKATLAREQLSYGLGMLVLIREASGAVESGRFYGGPAGARGLGAIVSGIDRAYDKLSAALDGDDKTQVKWGAPDLKVLSNMAGVFTGQPAVQVNRLIDAIAEDAANGKEGEALRRALFGAPRQ